jgi:hypothetical protein
MFVLVKIIIQYQIGCSYINKKCMCKQTFQRPSKYFWTSLSDVFVFCLCTGKIPPGFGALQLRIKL